MKQHLNAADLAEYWLSTQAPPDEIEEHLLECEQCSQELRRLAALAEGIRKAARSGRIQCVVPQSFVDAAARMGLRVRQYAPPQGGAVQCTVTPDDDLLISRLAVDLSTAQRVDLCFRDHAGTVHRHRDVPVNSSTGEVILNVAMDAIRAAPAHTAVITLVAVEESGERLLGEYTFQHTPSR